MHGRRLCALLAAAAYAVHAAPPGERWAPAYSQTSILNLASGLPELAPNTVALIIGEHLSPVVSSRAEAALNAAVLPTVLPGTGVSVKVNGILAAIEYASPNAVVFIVPPELVAGPASIVLTRNGLNGPTVHVQLQETVPGLLPLESHWALARDAANLDWRLPEHPAAPGDEILLYGTGWGQTLRRSINLQSASRPSELKARDSLQVFLNGIEVPRDLVFYAGVSPGTAGIYELRLRLPDWTPEDPEIRISIGGKRSQEGLRLRVDPSRLQPPDVRVRSTQ